MAARIELYLESRALIAMAFDACNGAVKAGIKNSNLALNFCSICATMESWLKRELPTFPVYCTGSLPIASTSRGWIALLASHGDYQNRTFERI